ncbi:MAG: hypothetical protein PHO63_02930 [Bacilli bacterium]|nr:hypothetical protein [Bacilli bacterium]MDD4808900.1 hypothetical protein [Bacilli bacterium]
MNVLKKIPLKNSINNQYVNCVYAKNNYYFLVPSLDRVYKYNLFLNNSEDYKTEKKYIGITYNQTDDVFFLLRENDYENIYITDLDFKEIGLIKLTIDQKYRQKINDICYSAIKKRIYITTDDCIYSITDDGYFIKEEYDITKIGTKTTTTIIEQLDGSRYPITSTIPIPNTYFTCSFASQNNLWISYVREDSSYLIRISQKGSLIESNYIDNDIKINSIVNIDDYLNLLILSDNIYNYIYITNVYCNSSKKEIINEEGSDVVLSSVATIASELSNILMQEGSNLSKTIKETNDSKELLNTSEPVHKTINMISELEQVLINELECSLKSK